MDDPNARKRQVLQATVLSGPGTTEPGLRAAAAANNGLSGPSADYVAKVHKQATTVEDADVRALLDSGLSEDQVFELTVAAATGAGLSRLDRVLSLLDGPR